MKAAFWVTLSINLLGIMSFSLSIANSDSRLFKIKGDQVPRHLFLDEQTTLPANYLLFVILENHFNSSLVGRSSSPIRIENFEIPLKYLNTDISRFIGEIAPQLESAIFFERSGEKWARWLLNPEDHTYKHKIQKFFKEKHGLNLSPQQYFIGYLTSSRSILAHAPNSDFVFSFKASTDRIGNLIQDKRLTTSAMLEGRLVSDYLTLNRHHEELKNFSYAPEPMSLGLVDLDLAVSFRVYPHMEKGGFTLPLTSMFYDLPDNFKSQKYWPLLKRVLESLSMSQEEFRERIVALRSKAPYVLGKSLAEANIILGVQPSQPHGQNLYLEAGRGLSSRDRVGHRDFEAWNLLEPLVKQFGGTSLLAYHENYNSDGKIFGRKEGFEGMFGLLRTTQVPNWLIQLHQDQSAKYETIRNFLEEHYWPKTIAKGLGVRLSSILGLAPDEIITKIFYEAFSYSGVSYRFSGPGSRKLWQKIEEKIPNYGVSLGLCSQLF